MLANPHTQHYGKNIKYKEIHHFFWTDILLVSWNWQEWNFYCQFINLQKEMLWGPSSLYHLKTSENKKKTFSDVFREYRQKAFITFLRLYKIGRNKLNLTNFFFQYSSNPATKIVREGRGENGTIYKSRKHTLLIALHKKWFFVLRISLRTNPQETAHMFAFTKETLNTKLHFFVKWFYVHSV